MTKKEAEKLHTIIAKLEAFQQCLPDKLGRLSDAKRLLIQFQSETSDPIEHQKAA
jgi:hypothetical protein